MSEDLLGDLLEKTSRTFALSIPMLPPPTDRDVTIAYLLFRIADTFEDAVHWAPERSTRALSDLASLLTEVGSRPAAARCARDWLADPPPDDHTGYQELLGRIPEVLSAYRQLEPEAREILRFHLTQTIEGMAEFVRQRRDAGTIRLRDLESLRHYCYIVAGLVGEMLTELFLYRHPQLRGVAGELRQRARPFGEGLQLVNILKDAAGDRRAGRNYLPEGVDMETVFTLAREDLDAASEYTRLLQEAGAPAGVVASNALPVLLAKSTLDRVEQEGPGAKLSRLEVFSTIEAMSDALENGRPVV